MQGLHLTADLRGIAATLPLMSDTASLRALCLAAVRDAGLHAVGELFHRFTPVAQSAPGAPAGITGVVLLAQSHLALHTWPELGAVTIDVFVCNFEGDHSGSATRALDRLIAGFDATSVQRQQLRRLGAAVPLR